MELIIRTQDRERLVVCRNDFGIKEERSDGISTYELLAKDRNESLVWLGYFRDKESAIEELDKIQSAIDYGGSTTTIVEISKSY